MFKEGDLITGNNGNLEKYEDLCMSEEAVLCIDEIDGGDIYCHVVSCPINPEIEGETVLIEGNEIWDFKLKEENYSKSSPVTSISSSPVNPVNTAWIPSNLTNYKLLKVRGR